MKKFYSMILLLCFVLSSVFALSSCKPNRQKVLSSVKLNYLTDLMIETEEVTAYSIRSNLDDSLNNQNQGFNAETASQSNDYALSFVAKLANNKDNNNNSNKDKDKEKNNYYLYSTTETYEYGNVEFNENSVSKVTFKKNISKNKDVYDKNGNLITTETTIEQDDIDSQINKIYTTRNYTFMQFVALVDKTGEYEYIDEDNKVKKEMVYLRPDSLTYDENGVADFDKTDYFSNNLTVSFVIDNATKYIYKIENFHIKSFKNGLVVDTDGNYYKISIDESNNLVFQDVMPNKDVFVNNVLLDNSGWTFVSNTHIDLIDRNNKIYYTTNSMLFYDSEFNIYKMSYYPGTLQEYLAMVIIDGNEVPYAGDRFIKNIKGLQTGTIFSFVGYYYNNMIGDFRSSGNGGILCIDNILYRDFYANYFYMEWFDTNYDMLLASYNNQIYYYNVDFSAQNVVINLANFTKMSEETFNASNDIYYLQIGNDKYAQRKVYSKLGLYGTEYYKIIKKDNKLEAIKLDSKTYEDNIFIFQPINKI